MASTNQTTHYELSQYVANDKPTYLVDYNGDMNKIDAGIYSAESKATVNAGAIGDLTTLDTTAKSDLVSAVNEVNTQVGTNTGNISTNTSNIATLGDDIGTMANLTTTAKDSLVNAVNEVDAVNQTQNTNITKNANDIQDIKNLLTFTNFKTYSQSDTTQFEKSSNISSTYLSISMTVARNSEGSVFKVYGKMSFDTTGSSQSTYIKLKNTGISPTQAFDINAIGSQFAFDTTHGLWDVYALNASIDANGDITFNFGNKSAGSTRGLSSPCIYFAVDFGDVPIPE